MNFNISLLISVVTVSLSLLPVHANVDKKESFWTNAIFSGHKWLDSSNCDGQTDSEMERALSSIVTRAKATPGFAHFAYPIINSFLERHQEKLISGNVDALVDVWAKYKATHATLWNVTRQELKSEDKNLLESELDTAVLTALAVASENPGNVQREQAFLHRQLVCTHHSTPGKEGNRLNFQAFKTYARAIPLLKETFFATLLFNAPGEDLLDLIREDLTTSKEPFVDEPTLRSWLGAKRRGELKGQKFATALLGLLWKTPLVDSILVNAIETAEKEIVQSILDFCGDCRSEAVLIAADADTSSDCELRKHLAEAGIKRLSRPNTSQLNQPASAAIRTPKGSGSKGLELTPSLNADSESEYRALIDIAEAAGRSTERSTDQKPGHSGVDWTKIAQRIVDIRPDLRSKALRRSQEHAVLEFLLKLKPELSAKSAIFDYVVFPTEYESAWKPFIAPLENSRAMLVGLGNQMGQEGIDFLKVVQGHHKSVFELAKSVKDAVYHGRHRSYDLDPVLEMMQFILIKSQIDSEVQHSNVNQESHLKRELIDFYFDPVLKDQKVRRGTIGEYSSSTPQYAYPAAPFKIAIIGGGPAGLATAITLAEKTCISVVEITVYDKRWVRQGGTVRYNPRGKRREQVVTIQNEVAKLLSNNTQHWIFKDKFEEVWRDSKNITIKEVEDRLLKLVQHSSFNGIIKLVPEGVNLDSFARSTDFHVIIGADGNDSSVKRKFFNRSAPIRPRAVSHALGINFKPNLMASMPPRPQAMNVFLTLAQTRFLLNSSGREGAGYLNMQLTPDEWDQIKTRNGEPCNFGNPGYIPNNGVLPTGISEDKVFAPYDSKGPLWQSILEGLKLFGFQEQDIASIVGIPISVNGTPSGVKIIDHTKRPHALAMLVGDAAFSVHFWPGRGLNSALKEAAGIAAHLGSAINSRATDGLREDTFADYDKFLAKLQYREHELRSFRIIDQSGDPEILSDKLSTAGQVEGARKQFKEKVLSIASRLQEQKGWPHGIQDRLQEYISESVLNNLEETTIQQLVALGPWPAMGGDEVFPLGPDLDNAQAEKILNAATQGSAEAQYNLGRNYAIGQFGGVLDYVKAREWYLKAAEQGFSRAQQALGFLYYNGLGVDQDYAQAEKWYRKSADQEFSWAQNSLGILYELGHGVNQDYNQAVALYLKAAEQGFAYAQYNLGRLYSAGHGVTQDDVQAVKWHLKAAKKGHAHAQGALVFLFRQGKVESLDDIQAVEWFRNAAVQGLRNAQFGLGSMYEAGRGVAQDFVRAADYFRMAANQGLGEAQLSLGNLYRDGRGVVRDNARAEEYFRMAAEKGIPEAQHNLAFMYENGLVKGESEEGKKDARAAEWYLKAAKQGFAYSQNNIGILYQQGRGVEKDEAQALDWFREAAEQGVPNAQAMLGSAYSLGRGIDQDYGKAEYWFRKAALQGIAQSQLNLGEYYRLGRGVDQNDTLAVEWYLKAAEQGVAAAHDALVYMYKNRRGGKIADWYWKATAEGNAAAKFNLGITYAQGQDYARAINWFGKAAQQGFAKAQSKLGEYYRLGHGVNQDHAQAVEWYLKAAKQGVAAAQYNLGVMYSEGIGVTQNGTQGVEWVRKAAKQGMLAAQIALGLMHHQGRNVGQDDIRGMNQVRKAAKKGEASAQYLLGLTHDTGRGVTKDSARAEEWYRKAGLQGSLDAQEKLAFKYHVGLGVRKDSAEATRWYRLAIDQGSEWAQKNLDLLTDSIDSGAN